MTVTATTGLLGCSGNDPAQQGGGDSGSDGAALDGSSGQDGGSSDGASATRAAAIQAAMLGSTPATMAEMPEIAAVRAALTAARSRARPERLSRRAAP